MDRRTAIQTLAAATLFPLANSAELARLRQARRVLECSPVQGSAPQGALNSHEIDMVETIAEIIIPETDTPGASAVGVHKFIELIVTEWFDPEEASRFQSGLAELDGQARVRHGADFLTCSGDQQTALVTDLDRELAERRVANPRVGGPEDTFFHWMKRLTLTGYFTSQEGMRVLEQEIIAGRFEGCVESEAGR